MYGKIFDSMYDGTLYGHWEAIVTLQQMLVLCNQDGVLDITPQAIAARTSIPLDIITKGIGILAEVDPYSRTPDEDGRRIVLLDEHRPWGWRLVNYAKYQQIKNRKEKLEADRIRIAERRKANKSADVAESRKVSQRVANVAPVTVAASVAVTESIKPSSAKAEVSKPAVSTCPHLEIIRLYHDRLPMGRQVNTELWKGIRAKHLQARWRELPKRQNLKWWDRFFAYCAESDFLTGKAPPGNGRSEPFEVSLGWIVNPENLAKITEGAYHSCSR